VQGTDPENGRVREGLGQTFGSPTSNKILISKRWTSLFECAIMFVLKARVFFARSCSIEGRRHFLKNRKEGTKS
jgi:hypothetical protein